MIAAIPATISRSDYLEQLWWVMHHSYSPDRQAMALTSYMDDSGSDDLSPLTTIGGPVMSREAFLEFSDEWAKMLYRNRISPPLHMTDFVRPYGKHIGMRHEMKLSLFADVSTAINKYKLYSISVAVAGHDFNEHLSDEVRKRLIGPYGIAFFVTVILNQSVSEHSRFLPSKVMAYLVDIGFPHSDQLYAVHAAILKDHKNRNRPCFIGSLSQDDDERVPALQAADVIAWASRRMDLGALNQEFSPLAVVLDENRMHHHLPFQRDGVAALAKPINTWIASGVFPKLEDLIRP